jgi:hypothetical protein
MSKYDEVTDAVRETIQRNEDRGTTRLAVPGGWLYCMVEHGDYGRGILQQHVVFVQRPISISISK